MILPAYRTWLLSARVLFIWKNDDLRLRRSITVKHSYCLLTSDKINGGRLDRPLGHQYDRKQLVCAFFRCYSRFFFLFYFLFINISIRYCRNLSSSCRHESFVSLAFTVRWNRLQFPYYVRLSNFYIFSVFITPSLSNY